MFVLSEETERSRAQQTRPLYTHK